MSKVQVCCLWTKKKSLLFEIEVLFVAKNSWSFGGWQSRLDSEFSLPVFFLSWTFCILLDCSKTVNQMHAILLTNSYILLVLLPAGGVIASIVVVLCLFWVGLVDGVGFENKGTPLNLSTLPVAMGLYGYCYSGHAVFPNIYTSLAKPNQYPAILLTW